MNKQLDFEQSDTISDRDSVILGLMILTKAAKSDGFMSSEELSHIVGGMSAHFGTDDGTIGEMFEVANLLADDAGRETKLLERVRNELSPEQRQKILTVVWRVIAADKKVTAVEGANAKKIREVLGLTMEQAMSASRQAEEEVAAFTARRAVTASEENS